MTKPLLATNSGVCVNLADIIGLQVDHIGGNKNTLTIELKSRYEFLLNPETGDYEKHPFHDRVIVPFDSYDWALTAMNEWRDIWQHYLDKSSV